MKDHCNCMTTCKAFCLTHLLKSFCSYFFASSIYFVLTILSSLTPFPICCVVYVSGMLVFVFLIKFSTYALFVFSVLIGPWTWGWYRHIMCWAFICESWGGLFYCTAWHIIADRGSDSPATCTWCTCPCYEV
jgi:hypothetical protein